MKKRTVTDKFGNEIAVGTKLITRNSRADFYNESVVVFRSGKLMKQILAANNKDDIGKFGSLALNSIWWAGDTPENWEEVVITPHE